MVPGSIGYGFRSRSDSEHKDDGSKKNNNSEKSKMKFDDQEGSVFGEVGK